ncbi:putative metal-dependent HD superfamily phosphohydrolase [Crossiella equi]|uniref:Metal-dependent HD superfamily phosphohydrolase n=1 Tax=Crossiella equi TaxID=130796 RepID=A0ABS5A8A2_9PSEU|nr:HD domain-containing protein [Crossiella equi]MBP2472815.1 putative metal-dependent HD superfamily phosphohydrolase [Crossiella equi]
MILETWLAAVTELYGEQEAARVSGADLLARYAQPHRRYHGLAHIEAVLRDSAWLAERLGLSTEDRALLAVAAAAHDVVYDGVPGQDERRSADWLDAALTAAGVSDMRCAWATRLVLATEGHVGEDRLTLALLDADLAILGAGEADYDAYARAVREEYAHVPDKAFRAGRTEVLRGLSARRPLYRTRPARERWETAAKANLARELKALKRPKT